MTATVTTSTLIGSESLPVYIESDMSNSLPGTVIVGLGDKAISEAKERIRSAIKNSKLENPKKRITINLSPANIPKDGAHYDLGMALSILRLSGQLPKDCLKESLIIGELGLDGSVRPVHGVIGHLMCARKLGVKRMILPLLNMPEAKLVEGVELIPVRNLRELTDHLLGDAKISARLPARHTPNRTRSPFDMSDITGQRAAKRALEIAAAGGHNILLSGPPGGGKTMLARTLPTIMPKLTKEQMIESTHIHSLSSTYSGRIVSTPPFRSPHHSASHVSLVGGGAKPMPGEVSLAHNGVLFLDEIPEFSRQSLEALRQPLEDSLVTVSRASATVQYPARSLVVATKNPCPCGYYGHAKRECICTQQQIDAYQGKLSGPLLDRLDMFVHVEPTRQSKLLEENDQEEASCRIQERVSRARALQIESFGKPVGNLTSREVKNSMQLTPAVKSYLDAASESLLLSSRAYIKTAKTALTIASLAGATSVEKDHIAEAIQFRQHQ